MALSASTVRPIGDRIYRAKEARGNSICIEISTANASKSGVNEIRFGDRAAGSVGQRRAAAGVADQQRTRQERVSGADRRLGEKRADLSVRDRRAG